MCRRFIPWNDGHIIGNHI